MTAGRQSWKVRSRVLVCTRISLSDQNGRAGIRTVENVLRDDDFVDVKREVCEGKQGNVHHLCDARER